MALRSDTPIFLRNTYVGAQWHPVFLRNTYEGVQCSLSLTRVHDLLWRQYTIEVIVRGHGASHMTRKYIPIEI